MIQKWLYLGNHRSDLLQNLTQCSWECAMTSQGAYRCVKHTQGAFSGRKQGKIQPGVFPIVFWSVSWMSSVLHDCNPVVFSLHCEKAESLMFTENKSSLRGSSLHQWLPP